MKKYIIWVLTIILLVVSSTTSKAQNYNKEGKVFIEQNSSKTPSSSDIKTDYKWKDNKGVEYPIYLHQYTKGDKAGLWTCYIIKTSKQGKEYKSYLKEGISIAKDIRISLGLEKEKQAIKSLITK